MVQFALTSYQQPVIDDEKKLVNIHSQNDRSDRLQVNPFLGWTASKCARSKMEITNCMETPFLHGLN